MNAMTEIKPLFEEGKRYRTRGAGIAKIKKIGTGSPVELYAIYGSIEDRDHWWGIKGNWVSEPSALDLMPGAIEDEPTVVEDDGLGLQAQITILRNRLNDQTHVIASMAAKIEAMTQQLDERAKGDDQVLSNHKGGWVNVYSARGGRTSLSGFYPTKADAHAGSSPDRIACIQIPDITEGEGL